MPNNFDNPYCKMLKNCVLSSQYNNLSSKTCGEIICQSETTFTIICKFCNIKIFEFNEFVQHLQSTHWVAIGLADDILNQFDANTKVFPLQKPNDCIKREECVEESVVYEEYVFSEIGDDYGLCLSEQDGNNDDSSDVEPIAILKKKLKSKEKPAFTFKCSLCENTFASKSSYEGHVRKHKICRFNCDKCSKTFARENQLTQHLVTHIGYSCKLCTKVFKSYDSLRYHKETHIQTKNFKCDFNDCNKAFVTKRRLHIHKRVHYPEVFVCEVCGSRQRNKQALTDHIRKHTGEKPFSCNLCDRRFATNSLMNEHKACHETERKHVCDVCGKSFNRPKALYHHKPLHLGIKKFVCKLCGSAYAQAAGLSAHMRKHKEDKITTLETNSSVNLKNLPAIKAN